MATGSLLCVTLVPAMMGLLVRGRLWREDANPLNRWLIAVYRPVLQWALRRRAAVISGSLVVFVLSWIPWSRLGSEFMPPLNEGSILYMPTTLPGLSVSKARELLRVQDSIFKRFPEVATVWGKAGRANTSTDPAGLEMFETTITLKPQDQWRPGMTQDRLIAEMDSAVRMPGIRNAWTMPIRGRIDMLATGIRTPVGVKVFGPDLATLEQIARQVEMAVQGVPGTRSAYAERAEAGFYLDIAIDRIAAARHGLNIGDVQAVIAAAIGGMTITQTVEGRERFGVRVRYPQELRDSPDRLARVLVPVNRDGAAAMSASSDAMNGTTPGTAAPPRVRGFVPLGQVATIRQAIGPMVVRTEGAQPTAWVYVDVAGRDIGRFVREAQAVVARDVKLPVGYSLQWSGQFEYMESARQRLQIVVPATLLLIVLLLYLNFGRFGETAIVMLSLPFALVGGLWFLSLLGYNWSVAVAIGFIALAGVAAETGVVMLLYLNQAWEARLAAGRVPTAADLYTAIMEGAVERVRPKMMTVFCIIAGLLPLLWSTGAGSSVMRRIAAPMIGGMISSTVLTLILIPVAFALLKERELRRLAAGGGAR
jgi:Cu(I)/Ag(I) efflux system membrane protein CusA/SilA